jgi:hypothetical protein
MAGFCRGNENQTVGVRESDLMKPRHPNYIPLPDVSEYQDYIFIISSSAQARVSGVELLAFGLLQRCDTDTCIQGTELSLKTRRIMLERVVWPTDGYVMETHIYDQ